MRHTWIHCNTLQHTSALPRVTVSIATRCIASHCNTLQHTATHCTTLQHTATHLCVHACDIIDHNLVHWHTLPNTATHRSTMQQVAAHCYTRQHTANTLQRNVTHRNILQHTATHCNTLQHSAAHCSTPPRLRAWHHQLRLGIFWSRRSVASQTPNLPGNSIQISKVRSLPNWACTSIIDMWWAAVSCRVLQCMHSNYTRVVNCSVLHSGAVCCRHYNWGFLIFPIALGKHLSQKEFLKYQLHDLFGQSIE